MDAAAISYADPAIGTIFFNLRPDGSTEDSRAVIEGARRRRESPNATSDYQQLLRDYLFAHHYPLVVHEWAHLLQAIAYPAVYLSALRVFIVGERVVASLARDANDVPIRMQLPSAWWETVQRPTQPFRFSVDEERRVRARTADQSDRRRNEISETDLLEEDASVFQYKVEIGSDGTGCGYGRWLAEQHRYRTCFKFLSGLFGTEEAFVALPGIVRGCFRTTMPLVTFAALVRLTLLHPPRALTRRDPLGYLAWALDVTERGLSLARAEPDIAGPAEHENAYFDERAFRALLGQSWHPLQQLATQLRDETAGDPTGPAWLLRPWQHFKRSPQRPTQEFFDDYWPPCVSVGIVAPSLAAGDRILMLSASKFNPDLEPMVAFEWAMSSMLHRHIAFQIVAGQYDGLAHTCPHRQCDVHGTGLCLPWPNIPADHRDCPFPKWFETHTAHRIDAAASMLRAVHGD